MVQQITTQDCYEIFLLACKARGLSKNSIKFYRDKIKDFINKKSLEAVNLSDVKPMQIREYLGELRDRELSANSCNSHGKALKVFFTFCVEEQYLIASPMTKVALPKKSRKKPIVLDDKEIKQAFQACNDLRDRLLLLFSLDTGLRGMEICNVNFGDVVDGKVFVRKGKGAKDRIVFIGNKTKLMLAKYRLERNKPDDKEPLFLSARNKRLTISGIVQFYVRLRNKTGNNKLTSHTIRRTALTMMLKSGMSIYHLKEIAGHEDIKTLQHYINIDDDLERAFNEYGLVDRL